MNSKFSGSNFQSNLKTAYLIIFLFSITNVLFAQKTDYVISAPAGDEYVIIKKDGKTVIPNGRYISPMGRSHMVAPHPYGLAISSDGNIAITANSGTSPISINILKSIHSTNCVNYPGT